MTRTTIAGTLKLKNGDAMKFSWNKIPLCGALALVVLCAPTLTACAKPGAPGTAGELISAPIHGVNYTAEPLSFVVIDPQNHKNYGGGEIINSYGAGGTMCCYSLPAKWHPGIKVEIAETYWLPIKADQTVPEVKKKHIVEVPAYQGGQVGALWVSRGPDGEMTVVSSGVQPDHQSWPGKVKGWPVPSTEYRRQMQDEAIAEAQSDVDMYVSLLDELNKNPGKRTSEAWNSDKLHQPGSLKPYKGPDDPAYRAMLKKTYESGLAIEKNSLANKKAARP